MNHFEFDRIKNCQGITYLKPHIFYCSNDLANWHDLQGSNDLANWHDLQDIKHIKANIMADARPVEFDRVELFSAYPYLKPHIWFYSNGLAIWHGLKDIRHMKGYFGSWLAI